jgi:hypothetical protein
MTTREYWIGRCYKEDSFDCRRCGLVCRAGGCGFPTGAPSDAMKPPVRYTAGSTEGRCTLGVKQTLRLHQ